MVGSSLLGVSLGRCLGPSHSLFLPSLFLLHIMEFLFISDSAQGSRARVKLSCPMLPQQWCHNGENLISPKMRGRVTVVNSEV